MSQLEILLAAALQYLGLPYLWGGSGPNGYDCSGFVREVLSAAKALPLPDTTSQGLFDHLMAHGAVYSQDAGSLAFYGKSAKEITHVMLLLGPEIVIGATGGDSKTTSIELAVKQGAFVKIRALDYRNDLVAVVMPKYPGYLCKDL